VGESDMWFVHVPVEPTQKSSLNLKKTGRVITGLTIRSTNNRLVGNNRKTTQDILPSHLL